MDRKYLVEWQKFLMEINPDDPEAQPDDEATELNFGDMDPGQGIKSSAEQELQKRQEVPQSSSTPQKTPKGKTPVEDGKADLVEVLQRYLTSMETNDQYTALGVAQVIYNACADWMNKQNNFANRPGTALTTKAAAAPTK